MVNYAGGGLDPVTKTLRELEKIIKKKNDIKWLGKRMMAKRGDPVAKAFAGSLHACHDTEFSTVGKFSSSSFGTASYVRRVMENKVISQDYKIILTLHSGCFRRTCQKRHVLFLVERWFCLYGS